MYSYYYQSAGLLTVVAVIYFISYQPCDVVATLEADVCVHRMVANYLEPTPVFQIKNGLLPLLTLDQLSISSYY